MTDGIYARIFAGSITFLGLIVSAGCGGSPVTRPPAITLQRIEELRSIESLLPLAPDSVVERYKRFEGESFNRTFSSKIEFSMRLIDSLNIRVDTAYRIDTLAIDHTFENFGNAARSGRTIFISSSYFFIFDTVAVLRSVIIHEFGHIHYKMLPGEDQLRVEKIWERLRGSALFYLFIDGEYSENARFGGHPEESGQELFASAFNLFNNRLEELNARLIYVDVQNRGMVEELRKVVMNAR